MRATARAVCLLGILAGVAYGATAKNDAKSPDAQAVVIVFKDGRQQSFPMADVARIEFKPGVSAPAGANAPDTPNLKQGHFLGKWELGQGNGRSFNVTLLPSGEATKSIGASHGTWTVVNGEARITWDDGSHDAIRRVGNTYEKLWYPDETFSGKPNNVTKAVHLESKPI
jgi:hypothetical protein